ncbi:hypothetical protein GCM10011581_30740 [Saccharopolyspora subtropica]|uniref:AB hydrolase-1 domain-containing protein n=1 Tax=Saccharopolyspora thermophila TaxID=89367 RepID=A0A917JZC1_9PSEU|nr:alpha/beta hydrolase [Saccharopolyspora subtropica]GGI91515.1 hypothetical protein GCM10011581_30740 [Saccharopolyspora subtropica]
MTDLFVKSADVEIAVRDHGGDGPPVLLLHGAGGNLLAWEGFAPLLTERHRVLAVDLRGHGLSGDGPWSWAAVLDDLDAVVDQLDLPRPAVVGHSLGGMLAAMWAVRHPDCPAAISLDGHRAAATHPDNYADLPRDRVEEQLAQLREVFAVQIPAAAQPMDDDQVAALLEQQRAFAAHQGIDPQLWVESTRRSLIVHNGQTWRRPGAPVLEFLHGAPEFADALPVFRQVPGPFLLVLATRLAGFPPQFDDLMRALHAGLRRDLADLTAQHPTAVVRELDASHGMVFEKPAEVAAIVLDFLHQQPAAA